MNFDRKNTELYSQDANENASLILLLLAMASLIFSFFAVIGGLLAAGTVIIAFIALIVRLKRKGSVKKIFISLCLAFVGVAVAGLGLQVQYQNVRENCDMIQDKGSAEHLECFRNNYSPWRGIIHAR